MTVPALVWTVRADDQSAHVFQKQRREIAKTGDTVKRINADLKSAGQAWGAFKSFGAGLGIGILSADLIQLPGIIRDVIGEASSLAKTADLIGVTTTELQELQFGFEIAGIEAAKTEDALKQFGKRLSEAESKGGMLAGILAANGIALRDAQGNMRPLMALLRDYADLIQRAGSEQEKLSLANEAFGRSGSSLVLALRNGADGVDALRREVDRAGGVLEDHLLRRAEELDDQFARMWRTFEISGKSAILSVASRYELFGDRVAGLADGIAQDLAALADLAANPSLRGVEVLAGVPWTTIGRSDDAVAKDRASLGLTRQLLAGQTNRGMFYRDDIGFRTPEPAEVTVHPTVLPRRQTGAGGTSAAGQRDNGYDKLLDQLREERELIGLNGAEQRKLTLLRRAGVDAASEQGQAIAALIDQIDRETEAQRQANDVVSLFGGIADSEIGRFVDALGLADDATGRLIASLAEAGLKAALLGQGPLASLFGTSGGGLLQSVMGSVVSAFGGGAGTLSRAFAGMYAEGGTLGAGQWGIAGEEGPEPVVGPAQIISSKKAFSGGTVNQVRISIQTQDVDSFRRSETQIAGRIVDAINRGQRAR